MTRRFGRFEALSTFTDIGTWRCVAVGAAVLLGLSLPSSAVPAYTDLLPGSSQRTAVLPTAPNAVNLPHVARSLATGAPLRIVAFGSSSTEGVGASTPRAAYPARLEAKLKHHRPETADRITVLNRGIGGDAVDDMLARLDRDVMALRPQLVIWQTGSNDPLRGVSLAHFRDATIATVRHLREAGIDVMLMEPQWCPKLDATPGAYRFRDAVRSIGVELGVPVVQRSDLMRSWISEGRLTREQLFAPDGLHMTDGGYDLLARAVAADIEGAVGQVTVAAAQGD